MNHKQKGFIALDFIIAFGLVFGLTMILFAFALTLSTLEIAQYLTFASARSAIGGNSSFDENIKEGEAKFNELLDKNPFTILKSNFFTLKSTASVVGNYTDDFRQSSPGTIGEAFFGARVNVAARILSVSVPFFGKSSTGEIYSTIIGSFLYREPAASEVRDFFLRRWEAIRALDSAYATAPSKDQPYFMLDNGG